MKLSPFVVSGLCAVLLVLTLAGPSSAQVSAGVVFDRDGLRHFHLAIGHVYGVPVSRVSRIAPTWIHPDELPVVYFLAREARVRPETVIALRHRGWSWVDVTLRLGLNPAIFVSHLPRWGPPYGRAYGYWRQRGRDRVRYLSDREVVDFVNAWMWSSYYHQPVTQVIVVRETHPSWYAFAAAPRWSPPPVVQPSTPPQQNRPASDVAPPRGAPAGTVSPAPSSGRGNVPSPAPPNARRAAPAPTATPPGRGNAPASTATPAVRGNSAATAPAVRGNAPAPSAPAVRGNSGAPSASPAVRGGPGNRQGGNPGNDPSNRGAR